MKDRTDQDIKESFARFAGKYAPAVIIPAWVTAVNDDNTIAVEFNNGNEPMPDVRLKSVVKDGNEFFAIPAVGSMVHVGVIDNSREHIVICVSEITEIVCKIDGINYSVTGDGYLIKKGDDTLRDALTLLIEAVQQIIVIQGRGPDLVKLQQSLDKVQNLLRNA